MNTLQFQSLNSLEAATYLAALKEEGAASAAIAIHMAVLRHSSSFEGFDGERLIPETPVDMLVLYKASAEAFASWPPATASSDFLCEGRVRNREEAKQRLRAVEDPLQATLAIRFASNVIRISNGCSFEQDLRYFVDVFLGCIQQPGMIAAIVSGEIKRAEDRLKDLDYW